MRDILPATFQQAVADYNSEQMQLHEPLDANERAKFAVTAATVIGGMKRLLADRYLVEERRGKDVNNDFLHILLYNGAPVGTAKIRFAGQVVERELGIQPELEGPYGVPLDRKNSSRAVDAAHTLRLRLIGPGTINFYTRKPIRDQYTDVSDGDLRKTEGYATVREYKCFPTDTHPNKYKLEILREFKRALAAFLEIAGLEPMPLLPGEDS